MKIYCCECKKKVPAKLIDGSTVYPHRPDLHQLPFWQCPTCDNYVGCHHKTKNRTAPLGTIPNSEIREGRQKVHWALDPIWKNGSISRRGMYSYMTMKLGREFHVAQLNTVEEIKDALREIIIFKKRFM